MEVGKKKINLTLVYLVIFLSWAGTWLYTPTLATFAASQGASDLMVGWIIGGFGLMQALFRAPFGILSDRVQKRKLFICIGMFAAFIGPLGMALIPTTGGLLVFRAVAGLTAASWPVTNVLVSSYFLEKDAPGVVAKNNLVNAIGNVLGMLFGGILVALFSQKVAFLTSALLGFLSFSFSLFLQENPPENKKVITIRDVKTVLTNSYLLVISLLGFLFQIIITGTSSSFTSIFAKSIGADSAQLGLLAMLSMLGLGIAAGLRNSIVSLLKGVRNTVGLAFLILAFSTIGIIHADNIPILLILQFVQGFSGYLILVVLMGECVVPFPGEERGTAMGLFHSIFGLGMFFGPLLSGALNSLLDMSSVYAILALMAIISSLVAFNWLKIERNKFPIFQKV